MPTATQRIYNFSSGPAVLPLPVLEQAQRDLVSLPGVGMSVMEISHRSKAFDEIIQTTERDVRLLGLGTTGGNLEVHLSVYNPNNFRLDATRLTYGVFVGDTVRVANGALDARTSVQAGDSTIVKIPVAFTYAGVGAAGMQVLRTGSVAYRVAGDVTVGSVVGSFTVPYSATGQFNTMAR